MGEVNCLYCGKGIADDCDRCPHCGSPSHFQQRGYRPGARRRALLLFSLFALAVIVIALVLPR